MKRYDLNLYEAEHKMKITLQTEEYKGHVFVTCGGNCKGAEMIKFATEFFETCDEGDVERLENDCNLKFYEEEEYFSYQLKDTEGNQLFIDDDADELANRIVAVEIVEQIAE